MDERKEMRKVKYFTEQEHRGMCSWVNHGYYGDRPACEGQAVHHIGPSDDYVYKQMGFCEGHWRTFYWGLHSEIVHGDENSWMVEMLMSRVGNEFRQRQEQYMSDHIRAQVDARKLLDDRVAELVPPLAIPRSSKGMPSVVYFIQVGENGPIKIGTTRDPLKRMTMLQTAHHALLYLRAVQAGDTKTEGQYHRIFNAARLEGEWFEPTPKLLATINAINAAQERSA